MRVAHPGAREYLRLHTARRGQDEKRDQVKSDLKQAGENIKDAFKH